MKALQKLTKIIVLAGMVARTGCKKPDTSSTGDSQEQVSVSQGSNVIVPENTVNETKVVTYPGPSVFESSKKAKISVDDNDLFVYETRVNHKRSFTWEYSNDTAPVAVFDFIGKVHIKITVNDAVTSAKVSPLDLGVTPTFHDNTIEFDLDNPTNYVVEYNDDEKTSIHLFTSRPEENPITEEEAKKDDNILYFGPGVYKVDSLPIKSNQTIYLAGGSYIYGQASRFGKCHDSRKRNY